MERTWSRRLLSMLLVLMMLIGCLPLSVLAAEPEEVVPTSTEEDFIQTEGEPKLTERNLALDCDVAVSGGTGGSELTDDNTNPAAGGWLTEDMKTGTDPSQEQTPVWAVIDLKAKTSTVSSIVIQWRNNKVWGTEYEIQTSATNDADAKWEPVAKVERAPANALLTQGEGQNIADVSAYRDTLTTTSTPKLDKTELQRYVRFYCTRVNDLAPGNNLNVAEIQIMGTNDYAPPTTAQDELDKITAMPEVQVTDTEIPLPEVPEGFTLSVAGSELEQIVTNDGTILGTNIGDREVTLLLKMTNDNDPADTAQKNLSVTIPDHSGSDVYAGTGWFETQGDNPRPGIVPSVQEWYGYDGSFTLTETSKIVLNDAANVGLDKVAANMVEDVKEISGITLTVENGTTAGPNDIYIESQAEDVYQTGEEGYILVTDESGLKIYSSTYVGCLYGTISAEQMLWLAEDHVSIPMGVIRDFPAYEVRGVFLDLARTDYRLDLLYDYSKIMLWYKMNEFHAHLADNRSVKDAQANDHPEDFEGFHRLESKEFPSLTSEVKKSATIEQTATEYFEQVYGIPHYTQEEWKAFQEYSADLGIFILNELDMPGHSLVYNRYAELNPDNIGWLEGGTGNATEKELLDLTGPNAGRALRFATTLWDEYTRGDDPVFQGDLVHIGADEYWDKQEGTGEAFINFAETVRQTLVKNGKSGQVRMWASLGEMGIPDEDLIDLAPYYQIEMWSSPTRDDPAKRSAQGFKIINNEGVFMYGNPARDRRDILNAEYIYNNWDPTVFNERKLLVGDPNLLGGKTCVWGDESQEGMIELDVHQRIMRAIPTTSEKTWGGTQDDVSFQKFELRANELAEGPGTQIAMEVDSKSALVLDYDFSNVSKDGKVVYDASGNGYDATLTGGTVKDGWLTFDGSSLMETPVRTLAYPYTLSFDLKLTGADIAANAATYDDNNAVNDANLFSGYDGRLQPAGYNGNLSGDVNYFTRDFKYQIPADQAVNITLVGTMHGTKLYVDGKLETVLSRTKPDVATFPPNSMDRVFSSFVLPVEKIGENLSGSLANIKVYNKALSAEEIAAEAGLTQGDTLVNVAQDNSATSYQAVGQDGTQNRIYYAAKAVDGDGFDFTNPADEGNTNRNSEISSCWYGMNDNSFLLVDLGQKREVSAFDIQWKANGYAKQYRIEVSEDGETWTTVYTADSLDKDSNGVSHVTLNTPVSAQYVKMQGVKRVAKQYIIQEFLVYEAVDKSALTETLLADAAKKAADKGLTFASNGAGRKAYDALIFAQAVKKDSMATNEDIMAAIEGLKLLDLEYKTVVFESTGGSNVPAQTVVANSPVPQPADPTRDGYVFSGWYTNEDCTVQWNFSDPVNEDMTLYAKWDILSSGTNYAITVEKADNGTVTSSRTRASKGLTITLTVKPDEGYKLDTITVTDK
ncbi:MAG: discoidin domain-containing protein, partial [Clostridiales bacterium]|nr:discoidin domain-containing protein [Clostridiales bacterium]